MNREDAVKLLELLERIAIALEGKPKTGKPNKSEGGEK